MQDAQSNLSVRVYERHDCALPATVRVTDNDRGQLRLTGSALNASGFMPVTVIDCSTGGLGLDTTVFIPKCATLEVVIAADSETGRPEFRGIVRARRVVMLDHTPKYFVGTSFEDAAVATSSELRTLLEHVQSLADGSGPSRTQTGDARA
jgi:hypothetical protein